MMQAAQKHFSCVATNVGCAARMSVIAIAALALSAGCRPADAPSTTQPDSMRIHLHVDFAGHGDDKRIELKLPQDATVFDALRGAQTQGALTFASRGSGETAFVTAIDSVENQAAAGDNWIYRVNGQLGERSCDVHPLENNDTVQWRFGRYP